MDRELLDYVQRKMHQMPSLDAGLFGRITPRFDPDRVAGAATAAADDLFASSATATRSRADAGLDDEDDVLGLDDDSRD
jgi:hypothetical protein